MFDPQDSPRVFALPPGVDFAAEVVAGLAARSADLSRVTVFVNTARMQRRLRAVFDAGPPRLLPRLRLVTDLAQGAAAAGIAPPVSTLRRRLELAQAVGRLLDSAAESGAPLAPRAALYDLADSLARLMDEMQGEGVAPAAIAGLDVADHAGHWQRAQAFLNLLEPYFAAHQDAPDPQARQRLMVTALQAAWAVEPPRDPIIVAGSTGSRGATRMLMEAVARLPQGALILPGFDTDMPRPVWDGMGDARSSEDHPQYRFRQLLDGLELAPETLPHWTDTRPPVPARNALVSLSLRPAPVTDQWRRDGPALGDLTPATDAMTLVEAPTPRAEAAAIALRLRQAAAQGRIAALITPDRVLTRQVAAALDRWDIVPDDSAGQPLHLSPPGRFMRLIGDLRAMPLTGEALLELLKHPLCHSGAAARNDHLLFSRDLELHLRRHGPAYPTGADLQHWAAGRKPEAADWAAWLARCIDDLAAGGDAPLADHFVHHQALAARLAAGPGDDGTGSRSGGLYDRKAGRELRRICDMLDRDADAGGPMSASDYASFIAALLADGVVRDPDLGHPLIRIWGTLEARVGGADLVILGGMNDGIWPEAASPDPWLNRAMRAELGLLLPERQIGLSAHDYQQAVCAPEVWITRARRDAEAETVPSRWVNRLVNLMSGLPAQNGPAALKAMRARGQRWLDWAAALDTPQQDVPRVRRPSPRPPVAARPTTLSVTQIKTLIRDPYAIYAQKVLRLAPLDPLRAAPDGRMRGVLFHAILQDFIDAAPDVTAADASDRLMAIAEDVLQRACPSPIVRAQWLALLRAIAADFLAAEAARHAIATPLRTEARASLDIGSTGVRLRGTADRIDRTEDGHAVIYDYKTGTVPTAPAQQHFDKQLLIEAAMLERGAFDKLPAMPVADARFLAIKRGLQEVPAPLDKAPPDQVWEELIRLIVNWQDPARGYSARLAMFSTQDQSYYDHLARRGEWADGDAVDPVTLT